MSRKLFQAEILSMPNAPQAESVLAHLRETNPQGYEKLQNKIIQYIIDNNDMKHSFSVNAADYGINEICCCLPQGGVKSIIFTQINVPTWSKQFTGTQWRIDAKRLFGYMGKKMIPVKELIIDVKLIGNEYFIANITTPPPNDVLTFGPNRRGVSFAHLVGTVANPSFMDKKFNLEGREGISIKSGLGMDPLVQEELFKKDGNFVRLGDYAVELVRTAVMPVYDTLLACICDIDMDKIRSVYGGWSPQEKENYPFMKFSTEADPHFKSFGPQRHYMIDSIKRNETNLILALDAPDPPRGWLTNPEVWEILLTDFAKICEKTI